ncbi:hypothetical protein [Novosphingobium mangrovi (ex Hu et al. 2023)]|uniref:Cellulose biosynthesis protein BcsR n=1 Tax=Novosphingobium mangrovi (ex Hu et al. 2023) TaxID=2930094 RepID=A0ABT0AHR0_9SPHN|nr:hypothetical protein [Novosphingobium mangrovi (ex Hu et al. 2023)]MCJ1962708.1 hypothetical protein [Novosphingobium mangrovi (ex Hu et al. 2023)]
MRVDASNLLNRLGRQDFSYKEFEDRFTELELWPMLEALLKDPRLLELDGAAASGAAAPSPESLPSAQAPAPEFAPTPPRPAAPSAPEPSATDSIGALFRRYEGPNAAAAPAPPAPAGSGQDVRAMLRHLSELGSRGEI